MYTQCPPLTLLWVPHLPPGTRAGHRDPSVLSPSEALPHPLPSGWASSIFTFCPCPGYVPASGHAPGTRILWRHPYFGSRPLQAQPTATLHASGRPGDPIQRSGIPHLEHLSRKQKTSPTLPLPSRDSGGPLGPLLPGVGVCAPLHSRFMHQRLVFPEWDSPDLRRGWERAACSLL